LIFLEFIVVDLSPYQNSNTPVLQYATVKGRSVVFMNVDNEKCVDSGTGVQDCPLGAIRLKKKKAAIDDRCSQCGACMRVCPEEAISVGDLSLLEGILCDACPIECRIKEGNPGACQRYLN